MHTICDLITKAKLGDQDSMMEILTTFTPLIKKYSYKLNYEDAENDLIANTIQLVYDMPHFENDGQAVAYIECSVRNAYIKHVKNQIELRENETSYDPEIIHNMEACSEPFNEINIDLHVAIQKLSPNQQKIIVYKFFMFKSDKDIMKELKISRQAVYKNKIRALEILKKYLENGI